jgi:ribosomal protein L40E
MLGFIPLILVLPCLIINISISVKRMHDLDKCGWLILIPIYSFIVCGFLSGTKENNKYGNVKSSYYSDEKIKANTIIEDKWVCGRCGTLNELYLPKCKKCENEFDNNEIGDE